jgi:hypothetical protein
MNEEEEIVKNAIDWSANELNTVPKILKQQRHLKNKYDNGELPPRVFYWLQEQLDDMAYNIDPSYFHGNQRVVKRKLDYDDKPNKR